MTDQRPGARQRGYDRQWEKVRAMKLRGEPLCQECAKANRIKPATVVHHVRPINGPDDEWRLAWDNLMSLCEDCHAAKHSSCPDQKKLKGCDARGLPTHPEHPWLAKPHE